MGATSLRQAPGEGRGQDRVGGLLGHQQGQLLWGPPSLPVPSGSGAQNWAQAVLPNIYFPSLVQRCYFRHFNHVPPFQLCGLGQVKEPLWASVSSSEK